MGKITEIFRCFGPEYLEKYPNMPQQHQKVIHAIIHCRSGEYGTTFYQCECCGKRHRVDRSCGNRHCPQCQYHKTRGWLETQLKRALPVQHSMLTFTMPEKIRPFCRANQKAAYGAMFKASSASFKALVKDPRFVGTDLPALPACFIPGEGSCHIIHISITLFRQADFPATVKNGFLHVIPFISR